jgi:SRSO17 transposase
LQDEFSRLFDEEELARFVDQYSPYFKLRTKSCISMAYHYLSGLFLAERGKRNIERMSEKSGQSYQSQHHFLSESSWSAQDLMRRISRDTNELLGDYNGQCLSIDESSNGKAGKQTVGVSRQHNGNLGKVDNCQTGVYASLCRGTAVGLINARLFLPEEWTKDAARCSKAGIPLQERKFKTKIELALEMVAEALANNIHFGWVNADGLYGQSYDFCKTLEDWGCHFVVDVHKNQQIYLEDPCPALPPARIMGRPYKRRKPAQAATTAEMYRQTLCLSDYTQVQIRKGTKGWITGDIHKVTVWVWNGKEAHARKRTLIIRQGVQGESLKYCLSNFYAAQKSHQEFAYMQAQRHWIERAFEDCKGELGMADMQVRKYTAWYHHQALVMMAMQFVNNKRTELRQAIPLLSVRDIRLQLIAMLLHQGATMELEIVQMLKRHQQRQNDINRYYKKQT